MFCYRTNLCSPILSIKDNIYKNLCVEEISIGRWPLLLLSSYLVPPLPHTTAKREVFFPFINPSLPPPPLDQSSNQGELKRSTGHVVFVLTMKRGGRLPMYSIVYPCVHGGNEIHSNTNRFLHQHLIFLHPSTSIS